MSAYAGLHAIVIKGFCKAKDYKPAEEFVDNRWRNAWNAVYVAGGWRLVQPNWAAMQVNTKVSKQSLAKLSPSLVLTFHNLPKIQAGVQLIGNKNVISWVDFLTT